MAPSSRILNEFRAFCDLSEDMIAEASKKDIVEAARILAMQAAHYARKYGEIEYLELAYLISATTANENNVGLLRDGMGELVCALAMVTNGALTKADVPLLQRHQSCTPSAATNSGPESGIGPCCSHAEERGITNRFTTPVEADRITH